MRKLLLALTCAAVVPATAQAQPRPDAPPGVHRHVTVMCGYYTEPPTFTIIPTPHSFTIKVTWTLVFHRTSCHRTRQHHHLTITKF